MKSILLASTNMGKARELAIELQKMGILLESLRDLPNLPEIEETGNSFEENVLLKANGYAELTSKIVLADDSGLVVPALSGAPGIFSARFGEDLDFLPGETKDQRNIRKLLSLMQGKSDRKAHFKTAIAVVAPQGGKLLATGEWHGEILHEAKGENGFGYDPVFFDPLMGKTAAEMDASLKNTRSHRGKALRAILRKLPAFLGQFLNKN